MLLLAAASASAMANLCVYRPEQEGRLNIAPVYLTIRHGPGGGRTRLRLPAGGTRQCARVGAGAAVVRLSFFYPYGGPGEPARWWSIRRTAAIRPGRNEWILDASPGGFGTKAADWVETGWHRTWSLWRISPGRAALWRPTTMGPTHRRPGLILGRP